MEKYLLLKELNCLCIDVINIIINMIEFSEFQYGRIYQLVIDKSINIKASGKYKRNELCYSYINSKTKNEIIQEAYVITKKYRKKKHNEWYKLEIDHKGNFYFGRCIQFILDSNNKVKINSLFKESCDNIIDKACKIKTSMLISSTEKFSNEYCLNGYHYKKWYLGKSDYQCGICSLKYVGVTSIDDTRVCVSDDSY